MSKFQHRPRSKPRFEPLGTTREIPDASHGNDPPRSLIDGGPTHHWQHIPGDHRRPASPEKFDLYWDTANQFGMVHPRAEDPSQTLIYYDTADEVYYTHSASRGGMKGRDSLPFLARLLRRLAWMADRGTLLSDQEIDHFCPRRPAAILDMGCGPGYLLAKCRDLGHDVQGVEPDPVARELCAGSAVGRLHRHRRILTRAHPGSDVRHHRHLACAPSLASIPPSPSVTWRTASHLAAD